MAIQSRNPFTNEIEKTFTEWNSATIAEKLDTAHAAYLSWRKVPVAERGKLMKRAAQIMRSRAIEFGRLATVEMGKLLREARDWEMKVCADIADYYADKTEELTRPETLDVPEGSAFIASEPIGVLLGVMPWNFPYYQVFRFIAPNLMLGNTCLVKHASNVPQCAEAIEILFKEAGFPPGVYTNLLVSSAKIDGIVADPRVRGVSLTGSEAAGSAVASASGKYLKKCVMELGGSDPFIVLEDADLDRAVSIAVEGKMFNSGQCCAAAKRFILVKPIAQKFLARFSARLSELEPGNPLEESCGYAPMVSEGAAKEVLAQVNASVAKGARVIVGGKRPDLPGAFLMPTVVTDIAPGMPCYDQEIFGPVANVFVVKDEDEAIRVANDSPFGLGSAICTTDRERALRLAGRLEAGMVYINAYTISQPELPFGGVKNSGFGRELSHLGITEFMNKKLIRSL